MILFRDENISGGAVLNMSTLLRNGTTYFQIVERYSVVLRKISVLHEVIVNEFKPELEDLINRIELVIVELENTESRTEKFFDLRRLLFQLEEIVDFRAIKRYNEIISGGKPQTTTESVTKANFPINQSVSNTKLNTESNTSIVNNQETEGAKISNPKDVWNNVSEYLKSQLNVHTYNVWVKPVEYHSFDNGKIKVSVQNQFYKNWLEDHCSRIIKKYLNETGEEYEVSFIVG
jgi:hypothetical protein